MAVTVSQCRAARSLLGWSKNDLAAAAGVGIMTVNRFEGGETVRGSSIDAIQAALIAAGIAFVASGETSQDGGEGVRFAP